MLAYRVADLLGMRHVEEMRAPFQEVQLRLLGSGEQLDLFLGDLLAVDRVVGALSHHTRQPVGFPLPGIPQPTAGGGRAKGSSCTYMQPVHGALHVR